jgi:prepilin-type N-terminal cleavage/methylation domain-containing protein
MIRPLKFNKGFTLLEVLVVVAVIGILAAVVLVALTSAKQKGDDSAIQGTMKSLQTQASIYHSTNGNFGVTAAACNVGMFADTTTYGLARLITAVQVKSLAVACFADTSPAAWVISAQLKSDATKYWCVDSAGTSKQRTAAATSTLQLCAN